MRISYRLDPWQVMRAVLDRLAVLPALEARRIIMDDRGASAHRNRYRQRLMTLISGRARRTHFDGSYRRLEDQNRSENSTGHSIVMENVKPGGNCNHNCMNNIRFLFSSYWRLVADAAISEPFSRCLHVTPDKMSAY